MKHTKKILFFLSCIMSGNLFSALAPQNTAQKNDLYILASKGFLKECRIKGPIQDFVIRLMKRAKNHNIPKEIGTVTCQYLSQSQTAHISLLTINPEYQKNGFGRYLFKYAIAVLTNHFSPKSIEWTAFPLHSGEIQLKQLVDFYISMGALDITQDKIYSTEMAYDPHAAHMVATLLPNFEPTITTKEENQIVAHNKKVNTAPYDILGTIAQYIGDTSEHKWLASTHFSYVSDEECDFPLAKHAIK